MSKAPTSEIAIAAGDLLSMSGDEASAQAMYARAEAIERDAWLTEARLTTNVARILAERGRTAASWRMPQRSSGRWAAATPRFTPRDRLRATPNLDRDTGTRIREALPLPAGRAGR